MFPPVLLAKLFVKGSLKNVEGGFEFKIKNIIDGATLVGMGPLGLDADSVTPANFSLIVGDKEIPAEAISRENPLPVRAFVEARIVVRGAPLAAGAHKINVVILTREAGKLQFSVTETAV
jgi:hydroxymethylglutaryl-CoA reductase (NADPH)